MFLLTVSSPVCAWLGSDTELWMSWDLGPDLFAVNKHSLTHYCKSEQNKISSHREGRLWSYWVIHHWNCLQEFWMFTEEDIFKSRKAAVIILNILQNAVLMSRTSLIELIHPTILLWALSLMAKPQFGLFYMVFFNHTNARGKNSVLMCRAKCPFRLPRLSAWCILKC